MSVDDFHVGYVCSRGADPAQGGRPFNEDNYLICQDDLIRFRETDQDQTTVRAGNGVLVAVADGMGGHQYGALAAGAAVQALSRLYYRQKPVDPESALHSFLIQAHRRLRARALEGQLSNIGTTLAVVWIIDYYAYWAHVGDSRIYLLRNGALSQLSRDQTRGEFARRDGRSSPNRPNGLAQSFIFGSRGLGIDGDIRIDAGTDTGQEVLLRDDVLCLCSDGLTNFVPGHRITQILHTHPDPFESARLLVKRAIAAGSDDNITVVVLRVLDSPRDLDSLTLW
jgi:protein phosphatase